MNDDGIVPIFVIAVVAIVGVCLAGYGVHACNLAEKATLGHVEQDVDTRNFERSEAYRAGLRRDFDELLRSYAHATSPDEKATLLSVIRHRAGEAPPDLVPPDVKAFLGAHP